MRLYTLNKRQFVMVFVTFFVFFGIVVLIGLAGEFLFNNTCLITLHTKEGQTERGERDKEGETEREGERERQRNRETDTETGRERKQRNRETEKIARQLDRGLHMPINIKDFLLVLQSRILSINQS